MTDFPGFEKRETRATRGSVEWSWAQSRDATRVRRSGRAGEERLDYPLCACRLRRYKMAKARNDDKG